jgi:GT2 family glycosyltransferase
MTEHPRVSVVVLTYNRRDEVLRTLGHLGALPEAPPIVVVDNASQDGTAEAILQRYPAVQVLKLPRNKGASGRNAGVEACATPYVALCDDDTWWEPGSLARAADIFDAHPDLAVVNAKVLVGADGRADSTCVAMGLSPLKHSTAIPGAALLGFLAGASVARRTAFLAAGGFEERFFIGGEESLLALDLANAGWALTYVPECVVRHLPSVYRDSNARRTLLARNAVWTTWLRRQPLVALRRTAELVRQARRDRCVRDGLTQAVRGMPWVIANRHPLRPELEAQLQLLEAWERSRGGLSGDASHLVEAGTLERV